MAVFGRCDTRAQSDGVEINNLQRSINAETNIRTCNANTQRAYSLKVARTQSLSLVPLAAQPRRCLVSSKLTFPCLQTPTESLRVQDRPQFPSCCCLLKEIPHYCPCTLSYFLLPPGMLQLAESNKAAPSFQAAAELRR